MLDSKRNTALVAILFAIATSPLNVVPLTIGALVTVFAVTEDAAGGLLTLELLTMAGAAFLLSPLDTRALNHKLAIAACVLTVLAAVTAAQAGRFEALYWSRLPGGLGAGLLLLICNVAIAQARDPVRVYGIAAFSAALIAVGLLFLMPVAIDRFGLRGAYWPLALLAVISAPLWLRWRIDGVATRTSETSAAVQTLSRLTVGTFLVGNLIIQCMQSSYYAFVERRAVDLGLDAGTIGLILGAAYMTNLLSTSLASWLGQRLGYMRPLAISLIVHLSSIWLAMSADHVTVFIAAVFGQAMSYFFSIPFQLGIGASLDTSGRLAAVSAGVFFFGLAIGPLVGGLVITAANFATLGNLIAGGTLFGLVLYAISLRRHFGAGW